MHAMNKVVLEARHMVHLIEQSLGVHEAADLAVVHVTVSKHIIRTHYVRPSATKLGTDRHMWGDGWLQQRHEWESRKSMRLSKILYRNYTLSVWGSLDAPRSGGRGGASSPACVAAS